MNNAIYHRFLDLSTNEKLIQFLLEDPVIYSKQDDDWSDVMASLIGNNLIKLTKKKDGNYIQEFMYNFKFTWSDVDNPSQCMKGHIYKLEPHLIDELLKHKVVKNKMVIE